MKQNDPRNNHYKNAAAQRRVEVLNECLACAVLAK